MPPRACHELHPSRLVKTTCLLFGALPLLSSVALILAAPGTPPLFTQTGSDLPFKDLKSRGRLTREQAGAAGVGGSRIRVNREAVEAMPEAKRRIEPEIKLHTLLNSAVPRKDFGRWSRWYQEDGHTQVFRLFRDEVNLHGSRALAARVEAFSEVQWDASEGAWHEWNGVVTAINPVGMNLQVKNSENDWAVAVSVGSNGDVRLNHRRGEDRVVARNMIGRPFLLRVRDNGVDYEVYLDGTRAGDGRFPRPKGKTTFRWGMYVGANEVRQDAMIFFSGVTVDGKAARP